jgi:hypothetical protein
MILIFQGRGVKIFVSEVFEQGEARQRDYFMWRM